MEVIKILNCAAESLIAFLFIGLLAKKRFKAFLAPAAAVGAAAAYLSAGTAPTFRELILLIVLVLGSFIVFKDRAEVLLAYSLTSLYILNISDLIFGNFAAALLNKRFSDAVQLYSPERLIIKVFAAALLGIIYLLLRKNEDTVPRKFWWSFDTVIFGFLSVTVIFSGAYHYSAVSTDKGNMITVSAIALIFLASCLTVIYFFSEICTGIQREKRLLLLEKNYSCFREQLALQNENALILKKIRHDIINHLTNVRSLLSLNEIDSAMRLLDEAAEKTEGASLEVVNTGNRITDAVIMSKSALCRSRSIAFNYRIGSTDALALSAADISSLISNMLDNAIEAAEKAYEPRVELDIFNHNAYHVIRVENSIPETEAPTLQTAKQDTPLHGYGMQIIDEIAEKYDGNFTWKYDKSSFIATVFIKKR